MTFTSWEGSKINAEPKEFKIEVGPRHVKIDSAQYDPDTSRYDLTLEDLENGDKFTLAYWLMGKDKTGQPVQNRSVAGTFGTLGRAVYGPAYDPARDGVLAPCDLIGAVVIADIKLSQSKISGAQYRRVYTFLPVTDDMAVLSDLPGQFFLKANPAAR